MGTINFKLALTTKMCLFRFLKILDVDRLFFHPFFYLWINSINEYYFNERIFSGQPNSIIVVNNLNCHFLISKFILKNFPFLIKSKHKVNPNVCAKAYCGLIPNLKCSDTLSPCKCIQPYEWNENTETCDCNWPYSITATGACCKFIYY